MLNHTRVLGSIVAVLSLFEAGEDFELMAQRTRRHWSLSDATTTRGLGGHGAENEASKVVVYMAI